MMLESIDIPTGFIGIAEERDRGPKLFATGQPLHVYWETFYTGDLANKALRKKRNRPVVFSSYCKNTADEAPGGRVIASIFNQPEDYRSFYPGARQAGVRTLFYTPKLTADQIVHVDMVSKATGDKDLKKVAGLLEKAGSIPLVGPVTGWLTVGAKAVRIGSKLAGVLQRDQRFIDMPFTFSVGAGNVGEARHRLASPAAEALWLTHRIERTPSQLGGYPRLVHRSSGEAYAGEHPYLILTADQVEQPELADFEPRMQITELLKGWVPKEGTDIKELIGKLASV